MQLLVTRPEPEATATAGRLRALGHAAIVEPMLSIAFNAPPADLPEPALIVFTSRNGVRAFARWPQAAAWRTKIVVAAGQATAAAARDAGFGDVRQAGGDVAAVAEYVRAGIHRDGGPILYPAARDRAGALSGGLAALGYEVRTVEAYRAEAATQLSANGRGLVVAGMVGGVLVYSRRTAMAFRNVVAAEGLETAARGFHVFAISAQAADPLSGFVARVHVAVEPTEDGLLALLPPPG
jgi:uroporphyrinogen-III synthase